MDFRRIRDDLIALGLLALVVFVGLSLVSYDPADPPATTVYPQRAAGDVANLCGAAGAAAAHWLYTALGVGAWGLLAGLVVLDVRMFSRGGVPDPLVRVVVGLLVVAAFCTVLQATAPGLGGAPVVGSGGYLGALGAAALTEHFLEAGAIVLLSAVFLAGLILTGETWTLRLAGAAVAAPLVRLAPPRWKGGDASRRLRPAIRAKTKAARGRATGEAEADPDSTDSNEADAATEVGQLDQSGGPESAAQADGDAAAGAEPDRNRNVGNDDETGDGEENGECGEIRVNPPAGTRSDREAIIERLESGSRQTADEGFQLPDLELLEDPEDFPYELLAKKARIAAATLEKTFREFGLNIRVVEIDTGPVITQFELALEPGLRLSKVTALADDLAIALRVPSVRVVAPIPGKNTVGVEVPNEKQVMVRLRELLESCPKEIGKRRISVFLGKDVSGRPLTVDLTRMPHLLIAGRTGTGKSVCLNAIILSILMTRSPDEVKMLMIDPKMVELSPYKRVPHLMHPVITDMKKAEAVLAWAVDKMEERYDLLARCGVRHLDNYNKLGKERVLQRLGIDPEDPEQMLEAEKVPDKMPYIIIVADEMADMMMTSGKDVEGHIIRLAQKSRAVGIHLVLATQKPTVDVITGLIKSNLPARISFQVASRSDSRVVLDEMGAERLLGNGDMLYLAPGTSHLTRAQGTYVSDEEINEVIEFYGDQEPQYSTELAQLSASGGGGKGGLDNLADRDELYEQAVEIVIQEGRGSTSLLQRALGIGYGRAARLIDYMAEDGIVGDYNGSQAREVLYTAEQWEALRNGESGDEL